MKEKRTKDGSSLGQYSGVDTQSKVYVRKSLTDSSTVIAGLTGTSNEYRSEQSNEFGSISKAGYYYVTVEHSLGYGAESTLSFSLTMYKGSLEVNAAKQTNLMGSMMWGEDINVLKSDQCAIIKLKAPYSGTFNLKLTGKGSKYPFYVYITDKKGNILREDQEYRFVSGKSQELSIRKGTVYLGIKTSNPCFEAATSLKKMKGLSKQQTSRSKAISIKNGTKISGTFKIKVSVK